MKKWKTKDGQKIRIKDMSDSHLLNTIKFLERMKKNEEYQLQYMADMMDDESDMQWAAGRSMEAEAQMDICDRFPIYADLEEEAIRRKLLTEQ